MYIDPDKTNSLHQLSLDKTFSKAAQNLGISQPALTKKIARLEDELETSLVIRNSRGIQLTDSGIEVLRYHEMKKDLDNELINKLSIDEENNLIGEINVATLSSLGSSVIIPTLAPLITSYPQARMNFIVKESKEIQESLMSGEANFVISNNKIELANVINTEIGREENVHIVPKVKNYPETFLDHDLNDQTTIQFFKDQRMNIDIKRNFFDDINNIMEAVRNGYGQAIASKHLVKNDKGVSIKRHRKRVFIPVYLSYFNRPYFSTIHKEVIKLLSSTSSKFL